MNDILTAVQSIIDSNPKACWRTLVSLVAKAHPIGCGRDDVRELVRSARPNCKWEVCDTMCSYSERSELEADRAARAEASKPRAKSSKKGYTGTMKNAKSKVITLQSLSFVNEMIAAGEVDDFDSFLEEAKETAEEWGLGLTNIKVNKGKDVITAKVAFNDIRHVKAWMARLSPEDGLEEAELNLL